MNLKCILYQFILQLRSTGNRAVADETFGQGGWNVGAQELWSSEGVQVLQGRATSSARGDCAVQVIAASNLIHRLHYTKLHVASLPNPSFNDMIVAILSKGTQR